MKAKEALEAVSGDIDEDTENGVSETTEKPVVASDETNKEE